MRNDSMILDPLLTVPIYVHKAPETKFHKADLCYEVRGHSNAIYNLVSDRCVAVIGEFVHMPSPWQHLNTLGAVGMVAIGGCHNTGHCMSLAVSDNGDCVATINNHPVLTSYHQYGISVTKSPGNVKIKVSHCEYVDLTMWVMYRKIDGLNMMKYVVTRGLNMHPTSHGLIGQFWNVPITIRKANDTNFNDMYEVVVQPQESAHRSLYAEYNRHTWSGERKPCLYADTSQGNRHTNERDSVIEGYVFSYHVPSLHSTDYVFSKFESSRCEAGSS